MNLIHDPWIPVRTRDGDARISLLQIADAETGATEIASPRPDFTAALYQLGIGLLQTAFAPEDLEEWSERYQKAPSPEDLRRAFRPWETAFELDPATGPAFMQDLDPMTQAEPVAIAKLLIDTPGDKTVSDNNDLFLHAGGVQRICPACAAMALLTLQINAPSGGAGHRVSLRGGGPLTTVRLPRDPSATLFQKIWSNIVPASILAREPPERPAEVMPWLGPTRTSDAKDAGGTTPLEAHELQAFWSMPRRIRLDWKTAEPGVCDVCGRSAERCLRQYRTRPYGVNYMGAWLHPLTPYVLDATHADLPLSLKGQRGGVGYRHWLGLALGSDEGPALAGTVVRYFNRHSRDLKRLAPAACGARLWCFGYDMDNMKARCWYDATLPLPSVDPTDLPYLNEAVEAVLDSAGEMAALTRKQAGAATHPDGAADPAVMRRFWQATEAGFYLFLQRAMDGVAEKKAVGEAAQQWLGGARARALEIFDSYARSVPIESGDMQAVVVARHGLEQSLFAGRSRQLWNWSTRQKEAAE